MLSRACWNILLLLTQFHTRCGLARFCSQCQNSCCTWTSITLPKSARFTIVAQCPAFQWHIIGEVAYSRSIIPETPCRLFAPRKIISKEKGLLPPRSLSFHKCPAWFSGFKRLFLLESRASRFATIDNEAQRIFGKSTSARALDGAAGRPTLKTVKCLWRIVLGSGPRPAVD